MPTRRHTPAWLSFIGAAGLAFGVWQYVETRIDKRTAEAKEEGRREQVIEQLRERVDSLEDFEVYMHDYNKPAQRKD